MEVEGTIEITAIGTISIMLTFGQNFHCYRHYLNETFLFSDFETSDLFSFYINKDLKVKPCNRKFHSKRNNEDQCESNFYLSTSTGIKNS